MNFYFDDGVMGIELDDDTSINDTDLEEVTTSENDMIEYDVDTDTTCYVSSPTDAPTSSAQQSAIWLLEIRNILLIFVLGYFTLIFYSKIKNTFLNFFDM